MMLHAHILRAPGLPSRSSSRAPPAIARPVPPVRVIAPERQAKQLKNSGNNGHLPAVKTLDPPAKAAEPKAKADAAEEPTKAQHNIYHSLGEGTKILGKPRVVILGSGWGAMSMMKSLPADIRSKYDIMVVSPRTYFLYTPLLPAVATGTMEERSIVESVRNLVLGKGEYYEAMCKDIDPARKELVCCFPKDSGFPDACFSLAYDILIVAVGSVNNTFGIKGVQQYCNFFKSIEDANALRCRISECFERAALPGVADADRKQLLSFVVVGGGPTGVEVAAELYDMVHEDLQRLYPSLIPDVSIRVVELMDHVLSTYDRAISIYTAEQFKRAGITLVLNSRVSSVSDGVVTVVNKANETSDIPFGACVWATGVAMNPLIKTLQEKLPGQNHFRSILTDEKLCVLGSNGSIYAIGDASTICQPKALDHAEELFLKADKDQDDHLTLEELRDVLQDASSQFHHLREHLKFMEDKQGMARWGGMAYKVLSGKEHLPHPLKTLDEDTAVSRDEFKALLSQIDSGLRALPATAQVARQQGDFLASLLTHNKVTGDPATTQLSPKYERFQYQHKGSAAYVGGDKAVFDVPKLGHLTGLTAGVVWKSFETFSQFSFRNKCLVASDWVRTKLFGRDISRV